MDAGCLTGVRLAPTVSAVERTQEAEKGAATSWLSRARRCGAGDRWLLWPVLVGTLPALVILVVALANVNRYGISRGDYALIEMQTRSALHGKALVGPYSRWGWNHPGPMMFYWFAPFFGIFDQRPESLGVAAATLNTLCFGSMVVAAGRTAGRRTAWITAAGSVAVVWVWGFDWLDRIWNPNLILVPLLGTAFCAAAVCAGRRWFTVALVALASFVVQSHVGSAPLVLAIVLYVVGVAIYQAARRGEWRTWRWPLATTLATAALLWAFPIFEQLTGHPGNVGQLIQFFRSTEGGQSLASVMDKMTVELTLTKRNILSNVVSHVRPLPLPTPKRVVVLLALIVGNAAIAGRTFRRPQQAHRFEAHLSSIALVSTVAVVFLGTRIVGEFEGYLTLPALPVGALLWMALALGGAAFASDLVHERLPALDTRRVEKVVAVCITTAVIWSSYSTIIERNPARSLQVPPRQSAEMQALVAKVSTSLGNDVSKVRIETGPSTYSTGAMLANQLEIAGVQTRFDPAMDHFFGRSRRSDGCEAPVVRITRLPAQIEPESGTVVWASDTEAVQVRRTADAEGCP